jgi:WD40 repeat protein
MNSLTPKLFRAVFRTASIIRPAAPKRARATLWRRNPAESEQFLREARAAAQLSSQEDVLAYGTRDYTVVLRDLKRERERGAIVVRTGVTSLAVSPDGKTLGVAGRNVNVIDLGSRRTEVLLEEWPNSLAFSNHGLLACGHGKCVSLWDLRTKRRLTALPFADSPVIAFFHDGRRLVAGSATGMLAVWDLSKAKRPVLVFSKQAHMHRIGCVDVSHDDQVLATACWDHTVALWNANSGEQITILRGHRDLVDGVAFSPAGSRLASLSFDRTIRIWDLQDVKSGCKILEGHRVPGFEVFFSPDGNTVIAPTRDSRILLWDPISGDRRFTLELQGVNDVSGRSAMTPDGTTILRGAQGTIHVLRSATPAQVQAAGWSR